jgi:glycosidase
MLIRDYTKAQTFKSIQDTLPYLKRLGINAIELMPVTEFEGNISWGYNPASHMALDKYYGTRDAFKALVDACHQNGIAVIMDVVYNHAFSSAPICQLYWDAVNFRPSNNSPYANVTAKHPFNVGYDLNHSTSATNYYTKRTLKYWLEEFHIDGFRFDLSKGLTQTDYGTDVAAWGRYDAARINTLDGYHKHIQSITPGAYTILEHFADNDEEQELSKRGMMTWGNAVHNATEAAMGYASTSDFGWLVDYSKRGMQANSLVGYASSHDEERMGYKSKMYGNSAGSYSTKNESIYLKRNALTYAFVHLVPGPKMIWQFDELGYDYSINWCKDGTVSDACRLVEKPVRWDYWTGISDRPDLFYQHAMFNHLKTNYESVYAPTNFNFSSGGGFKRLLLNGSDFQTIVVGNFDVVSAVKSPIFTSTGWWYNYLTGDSIQVSDVNVSLNFAAGDYRIYTSKKIVNPFLNNQTSSTRINEWSGIKFYPVPAEDALFLDLNFSSINSGGGMNAVNGLNANSLFDVLNTSNIEITDVSGKLLKQGNLSQNTWIQRDLELIRLDISSLNSGIYFIQIHSGSKSYKSKFSVSK